MLCSIIGHKFELSGRLNNMTRLSTLAYLADIFGKFNILQTKDNLVAFSRKIQY